MSKSGSSQNAKRDDHPNAKKTLDVGEKVSRKAGEPRSDNGTMSLSVTKTHINQKYDIFGLPNGSSLHLPQSAGFEWLGARDSNNGKTFYLESDDYVINVNIERKG